MLKTLAVVTMLIDHLGAGLVASFLMEGQTLFLPSYRAAYIFYRVIRGVGRSAFPIYCFLLVEGLLHTKSRPRYALTLLVFALLSELPFDLALIVKSPVANTLDPVGIFLAEKTLCMSYQNVFFTLFFGLIAIWLADEMFVLARRLSDGHAQKKGAGKGYYALPPYLIATFLSLLVFFLAALTCEILHTDYSYKGIIVIVCFYLLRKSRLLALGAGFFYLSQYVANEVWSFPGFLLMLFYNGERGYIGGKIKYFFYAFYPVHLILIWLMRAALL